MVDGGQFRSDLFYRLNVIPLSLPPLRDRKDDIPELAKYFSGKHAAESQSRIPVLSGEFLSRLQTHSWPGNVRELANFIRRVVTLSGTEEIDAGCFDREFQVAAYSSNLSPVQSPAVLAGTPIRELERLHVENTLALTDGNRTHAAVMLGISLRTLRNRIREYGLPPRRID